MDLFQVFKNTKFSSALLFLYIYFFFSMIKIIMKRLMRNTLFAKCKNQKKLFQENTYRQPYIYFNEIANFFVLLLSFYTLSGSKIHSVKLSPVQLVFLSKLNALLQRVILSKFRCIHKNKYE